MRLRKFMIVFIVLAAFGCAKEKTEFLNREDLFRLFKINLIEVEDVIDYADDEELARIELLRGGKRTKATIDGLDVHLIEYASIAKAELKERIEMKKEDGLLNEQMQRYRRNGNMMLLIWGYDFERPEAKYILEIFNRLTPETLQNY